MSERVRKYAEAIYGEVAARIATPAVEAGEAQWGHTLHAVMAVADAERAELAARVAALVIDMDALDGYTEAIRDAVAVINGGAA